jgi:putative membrane protein
MVDDHEEDVAKFRDMSKSASTPAVKSFAQKTLPTLEQHLKMAKDIAARVEKHASAR